MTLLGVGNEPIHKEEEMTIGDCGGEKMVTVRKQSIVVMVTMERLT